MTVHQNQVAGILLEKLKKQNDLYHQMQFICTGRPVSEVGAIAATMLISCLVLSGENLEEVLAFADKTFANIREMIVHDFPEMQADVSKDLTSN